MKSVFTVKDKISPCASLCMLQWCVCVRARTCVVCVWCVCVCVCVCVFVHTCVVCVCGVVHCVCVVHVCVWCVCGVCVHAGKQTEGHPQSSHPRFFRLLSTTLEQLHETIKGVVCLHAFD